MAPPSRPRPRPPFGGGGGRKFTPRRKVCAFCADKIDVVDYKDAGRLRRFLSERAKIEPRRKTGTCALHQRSLNVALKRARHLALLPYTAEHIRITGVLVREPGTGPRGPRPGMTNAMERGPRSAPEGADEGAVVVPADGAAARPEAAEVSQVPTATTTVMDGATTPEAAGPTEANHVSETGPSTAQDQRHGTDGDTVPSGTSSAEDDAKPPAKTKRARVTETASEPAT